MKTVKLSEFYRRFSAAHAVVKAESEGVIRILESESARLVVQRELRASGEYSVVSYTRKIN